MEGDGSLMGAPRRPSSRARTATSCVGPPVGGEVGSDDPPTSCYQLGDEVAPVGSTTGPAVHQQHRPARPALESVQDAVLEVHGPRCQFACHEGVSR